MARKRLPALFRERPTMDRRRCRVSASRGTRHHFAVLFGLDPRTWCASFCVDQKRNARGLTRRLATLVCPAQRASRRTTGPRAAVSRASHRRADHGSERASRRAEVGASDAAISPRRRPRRNAARRDLPLTSIPSAPSTKLARRGERGSGEGHVSRACGGVSSRVPVPPGSGRKSKAPPGDVTHPHVLASVRTTAI